MSFDDLLADTNDAFMDAFAEKEKVIYRPAGGHDRAILAIIDRGPFEPVEPGEKGGDFKLIISVENHPTRGISATGFSATTDRIKVPLDIGGELIERGFTRQNLEQDGGMLKVRVK